MPRRWWTLVAVSLATLMTYLDNNVINVAIPTIQRDLHLSIAGLEWVVSSYILVFAGLLLVGGRLADAYGRRRLFLAGLTVFTLASLTAGLAGSGTMLIGARVVQGLGAALMVPTTLAIIVATFDNPRERTRAVGVWIAIGAMALAFGPLVGGFVSQHLHWGWIFLINVPIGAITMALAVAFIGESRDTTAGRGSTSPGSPPRRWRCSRSPTRSSRDTTRAGRRPGSSARSRWPPWPAGPSCSSRPGRRTRWWPSPCSAPGPSAAAPAR